MYGFNGYATAVDTMLPTSKKVMHTFQVVHLAAEKLQACRQRSQHELVLVGKCEVER